MKPQIIALVAVLAVFGFLNNSYALKVGDRPTEKWMLELMPTTVTGFTLQPEAVGSKVSYRMGDVVYKELDPIGIAGQRFMKGSTGFDAVVVAGNRMESFHDQRWCFTAQGWTITKEEDATVQTKSYGNIPVKLVEIVRANTSPTYAAFTFRGAPEFHKSSLSFDKVPKFYADIPSMSHGYFMYELIKQQRFIGSEYRVIPGYLNASKEEVLKFTADYIDAVNATSKGQL
jgi:hypothetical protein